MQETPPASSAVGKRGQPSVAAPPAEGPQTTLKSRKWGQRKKGTDCEGWQQPSRIATPTAVEPAQQIESANQYGVLESLPDTVTDATAPEQEAASPGGAPRNHQPATTSQRAKRPTRPARKKVDSKNEQPRTPEAEQAQQIYDRPHQPSYFIPGKVEGRPAQFLLDTGCTTNLLGKHVFDRLPETIRSQKKEYTKHGLLADGTRLPFYGIIELNVRLRTVKT